ncbi:CCAAT/enhancer-binding protein zeta [Coccidioides immitis RMSCC 2394]|uniref:CCAAT/enhancer-binding protein zeta n=1 Tax=Coccidioides immitis RMSCC 2394 TaxID=404692 RepID=A0A0J7B2R6_COCIT|nr:CCAAT/enhancer-binding protein zeta [Coccidioides immitis RMSCC 2394]
MAKGKGKRASEAGDMAASGQGNSTSNTGAADSLPDFSGASLASLTERIELKLHENQKSKADPKKASSLAKSSKQKRDSSSGVQPPTNNKKGKKRDRSGQVIQNHPPNTKNAQVDDVLQQEIYAVGGTKEDYELLAGVESDSEMEDLADGLTGLIGKGADAEALRQNIEKIMKGGDIPAEPSRGAKEPIASNIDPSQRQRNSTEKQTSKQLKQPEAKPKKENEKALDQKLSRPKKLSSSNLVLDPRPDWYSSPLPEITADGERRSNIPRPVLDHIREYASSLLEVENKAYVSSREASSSSTYKFYSTIVSSGTLSDKISALTLEVQESPLHNVKALEQLVGLAKKRSRAQAVEVLRSLKDLFAQGTLLPSNRRLKYFINQPALGTALFGLNNWSSADPLPRGLERSHLIHWAFEDFLKEQYFEVLKILEVWCNDEIEFSRSRAVSYVYELLKEKPEQESNLLRLLVNKLGDPSKKIASRASYLLLQLQQAHPLMKGTIISAVESELLFRPGQSQHAKYYAAITLNQTVLSSSEDKVAEKLLDIYFSLFVSILKAGKEGHDKLADKQDKKPAKLKGKKHRSLAKTNSQEDELREKLISAVLTGVNRAYPFTASSTERLTNHINTLFRITHSSNFNTSIQALMLIHQLSSSHKVSADRFYRTLYESLLDPRITTSSKQALYLNLLYKALKADVNLKRVKAFVKRLVQILTLHHPSFICGVFYLIRELEVTFPGLTTLVDQPEYHEDDDEEVFKDVPEEDEEIVETVLAPKEASNTAPGYDSRKRDPEQSNADRSCLWELLPYLSHFHPSVSVGASQLLQHQKMSGKPDLTIHTLSHFLDRFVYRSPKTSSNLRGSSIMQPLAGVDTSALLVTSGHTTRAHESVNNEAFWTKKTEEVAAEDVFFHAYFNRVAKDKSKKKPKKTAKDEHDLDDSDAESEVWKALVDSRPELEGGAGSDDDLDLEDLESAMEDEEDEDLGGDLSGDEDVIFNDESSEGEQEDHAGQADEDEFEGFDEEDAFDMDVSDEDAFRDSDEDIPSDFDMGVDEEQEKETGKKQSSRREKRRKLKHLPTFASVEDYATLLDQEPDENV